VEDLLVGELANLTISPPRRLLVAAPPDADTQRSRAVLPATPDAAAPPPHGPAGLPAPSSLRWIGVGRERGKARWNPRSRRRAYLVGAAAPLDPRRGCRTRARPCQRRRAWGRRAGPPRRGPPAAEGAGRSAVGRGGRAVRRGELDGRTSGVGEEERRRERASIGEDLVFFFSETESSFSICV
jgi:hypothetical protein